MHWQCIPEIPPSPLKYSISLYCLSDALRLQDEREFIDDTSLIPERQPEPLLYEIDLHSAEDSSFIPGEPPISLNHNINLFPSDDLSELNVPLGRSRLNMAGRSIDQTPSEITTSTTKPKGAVRAKSGCYTCRIRRKVCSSNRSLLILFSSGI